MAQAAIHQPRGWERALRAPVIGYRLRPWAVGSPQSLLCLLAGLAVCAALLLAPLLCVAHCALLGHAAGQQSHSHGIGHAPAAPFDCQLHAGGGRQPAQQPAAPMPRAFYELLLAPQAAPLVAALPAAAPPRSSHDLRAQNHPAPPQRPPMS